MSYQHHATPSENDKQPQYMLYQGIRVQASILHLCTGAQPYMEYGVRSIDELQALFHPTYSMHEVLSGVRISTYS
jgi:hypothetical protein